MTEGGRGPLVRRQIYRFSSSAAISIPRPRPLPRWGYRFASTRGNFRQHDTHRPCHWRHAIGGEWTSLWTLNGAERLIERRKVETSSTSLNIHAALFTARSSCRSLKLYFAKGVSLFYGSIRVLFFLFTSSFCFSSPRTPVLHTVSSSALLSASNGGEIDEMLPPLSRVLTLLRLRWKVTFADPSV